MADEHSSPKCRFRLLKGGGRVVNPRTGTDDGKTYPPTGGKYTPTVGNPRQYALLMHVDPWFSAALEAISEGVGAAEVFPVFETPDPGQKGDPQLIQALKEFLDRDDRAYTTAEERLAALALDLRLQGYCAFEVGRDAKKVPVAWYHVPAATLRRREQDGLWDQVDFSNKVVATFEPYQPGGGESGLPDIMVIRKYDPCAQYLGTPSAAPLAATLDRMASQDAYNVQLLRKGRIPPWLLVIRDQLDEESYQRLQEWFSELERGETANLVGILDGVGEGSDLKKLSEEQADMAHIEAEKLMRERILGVLKVPPTKVSLSASNYATAYQEDQTFKFGVLQPLLRRLLKRLSVVGQEITGSAAYRFGFRQQSLEDYLQVCQAEDILLRDAVHTINQALGRLGEPGIGPAGDVRIAFTAQGPIRLEDLAGGNLPPTPGRLVDTLLSLRRAIEEAQRVAPSASPAPCKE
jgi:hypothetical protein